MDREAWRAAVHEVTKSRTRLSNWTELNWTECIYMESRKMVPMNLFTGWEQRHPDIENGPVGTAGGGAGWGKERAALKYMRCAVLHSVTSVLSDSLQLPWTITHQAPPSMGFSRQEYWSTLPCPSPGDLPDPGSNPYLLRLRHYSQILYCWATREALKYIHHHV